MRLLNKNTARRAAAAAALLTMTAAMSWVPLPPTPRTRPLPVICPLSRPRSWFRVTLLSTLTFRWGR